MTAPRAGPSGGAVSLRRLRDGRISVRAGTPARRVALLEARDAHALGLLDALHTPAHPLPAWTADLASRAAAMQRLAAAARAGHALVARRALSAGELADRLRRRGFDDHEARAVVDRFRASGLLNDAQLAENLAQRDVERRPAARRAIVERLMRRGLDEAVAAHAVNAAHSAAAALDDHAHVATSHPRGDAPAARAAAEAALDRTLRTPGPTGATDVPRAARRVLALLARRGFDAPTSRQALRDALARRGLRLDDLDTLDDAAG